MVPVSGSLRGSRRRWLWQVRLTQTEMIRRLGISQSILNRLENAAQNTTLKTLGTVPGTRMRDWPALPWRGERQALWPGQAGAARPAWQAIISHVVGPLSR